MSDGGPVEVGKSVTTRWRGRLEAVQATPGEIALGFGVLASFSTWISVTALGTEPQLISRQVELSAGLLAAAIVVLALVSAALAMIRWQLSEARDRWLALGLGLFFVTSAESATALRELAHAFDDARPGASVDASLPLLLLVAVLGLLLWWVFARSGRRAGLLRRLAVPAGLIAVGLVSVWLAPTGPGVGSAFRLSGLLVSLACLAVIAWSLKAREALGFRLDGVFLVGLALVAEAGIAAAALPFGSSRELVASTLFELEGFVFVTVALAIEVPTATRQQTRELADVLGAAEALSHELESTEVNRDSLEHQVRSALLMMNCALDFFDRSASGRGVPEEVNEAATYLRQGTATLASLVGSSSDRASPFEVTSLAELEIGAASLLGLEVALQLDDNAPHEAVGDPTVFSRVLRELLENVVSHAPGARALVRVRRRADGIDVEVEDDGPGLGDDPALAFTWGWRGDDAHTPGDGHGLVIARQLLEREGGSLTARRGSRRAGTCMTIRLPGLCRDDAGLAPLPDGPAANALPAIELGGRR